MARNFLREIMAAKSALNAVSEEVGPVDASNVNERTYYVVGSAGVSAGAVQAEESHLTLYGGTWAPNGSPVTVEADKVKTIKVTGVAHVERIRISTAIVGGTVSVFHLGR
jgi:hypothetical protein